MDDFEELPKFSNLAFPFGNNDPDLSAKERLYVLWLNFQSHSVYVCLIQKRENDDKEMLTTTKAVEQKMFERIHCPHS